MTGVFIKRRNLDTWPPDLLDEQFLWFKLPHLQPLGNTTVSDRMRRVRLEAGPAGGVTAGQGAPISELEQGRSEEELTVAERKMPRPDERRAGDPSRRCR